MNDSSKTSWSKLTSRLLIAVVLFAVANVIVYWHSTYFAQDRLYHVRVDEFFRRSDVDVLFLGDSKAARFLNTYLADNVYNVAFGGDSLRECYAKLRYLTEREPHPGAMKTLIVSADLSMFGAGRIESSNRTFADRYFLLSHAWFGERTAMLSAWRQQIPLFNDDFVQYLRSVIVAQLQGKEKGAAATKVALPWEQQSPEQRRDRAHTTASEDHRDIGRFHEPFNWYARIATLAKQRQMRVVAVRYPGDPDYFFNVSVEQIAAIDAGIRKAGVTEILDYHDVFADPADLIDPDHVSARGAYKILRMLETYLGRSLLSPNANPRTFEASAQAQ